jgi:glycyl-tRNA synthetase
VRASLDLILEAITQMVKGKEAWADVQKRLPVFESKGDDKE